MGLLRIALRRAQSRVRYVTPVRARAATGLTADVYAQLERDFGMLAPPVSLHSPAPRVLAASWLMLRETLLADGESGRSAKEAVATAVSLANRCPYCADVHGATLSGLLGGSEASAVAGGDLGGLTDPALRRIAAWAGRSVVPPTEPLPRDGRLAELIGTAVTFEYLNRMVNVFLDESPVPPEVPERMRGHVRRFLGRLLRPARPVRPGEALHLLEPAALPAELSWAADSPGVAPAFARACSAIDAAGERSVPPAVREVVRTELGKWNLRPPGVSRAWVEQAVAPLAGADRAAGRLALLTAMASYQVDADVVGEFRRAWPHDAGLVELTAWASLAAALRVGSVLAVSPGEEAPAGFPRHS